MKITEGVNGLLDHACRSIPAAHVISVCNRRATHCLDLRDDLLGRSEVDSFSIRSTAEVVDDYGCPFFRE